jgi:hypothetical protein
MRRSLRLFLALAVVSLVFAQPLAAFAQNPDQLAAEQTTIVLNGFLFGTWEADGGIQGSGFWYVADAHDSGSLLHSPVVGAAQVTVVLLSEDGMITIDIPQLFSVVPSGQLQLEGAWHVADGTDTYSTLHGAGQASFTFGPSPQNPGFWTLTGMTSIGGH